ncbi:MAG TPA: hypothetical protein DGT21_11855 [Armatimonadetes bacterium]|nr:hypothetical protein [Armatimonadota bacterium]
MRPNVTVEITQANVNEYVREHAEELSLPPDLSTPAVTFCRGHLEVSAHKQVLFASARVRAVLIPVVKNGRLTLEIQQMWAGPIPLPSYFHNGFADSLAAVVNHELDLAGARLVRIEVETGTARAVAALRPPDETPPQQSTN